MKNVFFFYPEVKENQPRVVVAGFYDEERNQIRIAKSACSVKDKFDKKTGRDIALGRARCSRPAKVRQYFHKGQFVGTNEALLPKSVTVVENVPLVEQFLEVAKAI